MSKPVASLTRGQVPRSESERTPALTFPYGQVLANKRELPFATAPRVDMVVRMAVAQLQQRQGQRQPQERQQWLRVLACAKPDELAVALDQAVTSASSGFEPEPFTIRQPEVGLALVTGRVNATGEGFGLGEMTVTRCAVRIGEHVGIGYVRGRAPRHAMNVAIVDALLQGELHQLINETVIERLAAAYDDRHAARAADVATSRVEFVTMVRAN